MIGTFREHFTRAFKLQVVVISWDLFCTTSLSDPRW
jgi:hypothetical protein